MQKTVNTNLLKHQMVINYKFNEINWMEIIRVKSLKS